MNAATLENNYMRCLTVQGYKTLTVGGIDWYEYRGFLTPAYLPHSIPVINVHNAKKAVQCAGKAFVRWDSHFGQVTNTEWWYIVKEGTWSLEQCGQKTKYGIKRGQKRFNARLVSCEEILQHGYEVCEQAVKQYGDTGELPSRDQFEKKVQGAQTTGGLEFFGVFCGTTLVGFAENYVQGNACLWESIYYHPDYLRDYSGYALIDSMLDHYLNNMRMLYVSDGCRSIYHQTNIQNHLIKNYNFTKKYSLLQIYYTPLMRVSINSLYLFRHGINLICAKYPQSFILQIGGLMQQEYMRRSCEFRDVIPDDHNQNHSST